MRFIIVSILVFFNQNLFSLNDSISISDKSGFYKEFYLKASSKYGVLVFETDGSEATINSKPFKDSLLLKSSAIIRFGVKFDNRIIYKKTNFYLIDFESTFPILSISTPPKNLYNSRSGIYVKGPNAWQDSSGYWINANYTKKWEKKSNINYITSDGEEVINQNAGLRIFGGMSRHRKEKSLRIIARNEYGKSRFKYSFFKNRSNNKYKHLIIRNSSSDAYHTRFRDVLSTQLSKNLDIDIQEFQPVNLFVNGEFWGVYNLRERIGQHYLKYNFGAEIEESNLLQGLYTADHGSNESYKKLLSFIKKNNLKNEKNLDSLNSMMDIRNFINYQVAQIYLSNKDYMGNIRFWQPKNGGKFRWIMYDTDLGFGYSNNANVNFLKMRLSPYQTTWHNRQWSTLILRKLLNNKDLKNEFINQICYSLSTVFEPKNINRLIDSLRTLYKPELMRHFRLVRGDSLNWEKSINKIRDFSKVRPDVLLKNTQNQFNLDDKFVLNISIDSLHNGNVLINGNNYLKNKFSGVFFKSIPIPIEITPNPLYKIVLKPTSGLKSSQLLKRVNTNNYKFWSNKVNDTINHTISDTLNYSIKFEYIGDSPWKDKIKINEIGGLGKTTNKPWVELFSNKTGKKKLNEWKLISSNGKIHINDSFSEELLLIDFKEFNHKFLNKEFMFLVDENNKLVDSVYWSNNFSKELFFLERPIPESSEFILNNGLGSPNSYNPNHKDQIRRLLFQQKTLVILILLSGFLIIFHDKLPAV